MTEISDLKSFGKVFLLTNIIPICDIFYAKKALMCNTSGVTMARAHLGA